MKFLMLVYTDDSMLQELPEGEYDRLMHGCITHADESRDACACVVVAIRRAR